uniref:interleukin-15 receptor subunit alpha n=1 Tax=Doryrhamphus excisus TaxID=161450 RepID=UPI0025AEBBF8|nr:interleukin-15 receptor subunit alpha [Doryrhamphus excisus]
MQTYPQQDHFGRVFEDLCERALAFFEAILLHDFVRDGTSAGRARKELVGPGGERGPSESSYIGGGMAALEPLTGRPSSSYEYEDGPCSSLLFSVLYLLLSLLLPLPLSLLSVPLHHLLIVIGEHRVILVCKRDQYAYLSLTQRSLLHLQLGLQELEVFGPSFGFGVTCTHPEVIIQGHYLQNRQMDLRSLLLYGCLVMVSRLGAVHYSTGEPNECLCSEIPPLNWTEPPDCHQMNKTFRYTCVKGYVRKAGTSNLIKCQPDSRWSTPHLTCIVDPRGTPQASNSTKTDAVTASLEHDNPTNSHLETKIGLGHSTVVVISCVSVVIIALIGIGLFVCKRRRAESNNPLQTAAEDWRCVLCQSEGQCKNDIWHICKKTVRWHCAVSKEWLLKFSRCGSLC